MTPNDSAYNSYNPNRGRHSFEIASMVMGILSLLLLCTGVLSIPAGALGILFASLGRKGKNPPGPMGLIGIVFSAIGIVAGTAVTSYAIYTLMTDPSTIEEVRQMYARYGLEMPDYPFFYQQ
ncbi:MAG: DUF4190 domain-containing protein [Lachnospiraceae bacterium]|nr:DUF4190 domain-containing protein [Lachnospiraceae bacterium]